MYKILQETVLLLVKSKIKIVFWFSYLWKTKLPTDQIKPVMEGEGKTGSGATAKKMAVVLKWASVPCLRRAVFRGNVKRTAI